MEYRVVLWCFISWFKKIIISCYINNVLLQEYNKHVIFLNNL